MDEDAALAGDAIGVVVVVSIRPSGRKDALRSIERRDTSKLSPSSSSFSNKESLVCCRMCLLDLSDLCDEKLKLSTDDVKNRHRSAKDAMEMVFILRFIKLAQLWIYEFYEG